MKKCCNKKCPHNGKLQSTSNFYRSYTSRDGLQEECIDCKKERGNRNNAKKIADKNQFFKTFIG